MTADPLDLPASTNPPKRSAPSLARPSFARPSFALLLPALLLLALLPLCSLGYGSDNDTYGVLQAGVSTWHLHVPLMSRHPGYWLYEAAIYALSALGGYRLTNLASLIAAAALAWRLWVWATRLGIRPRALLCCCLIATPAFAVAACSTMDYLWALLCLVLCGENLLQGSYLAATLLAALTLGLRAADGVVLAGGYLALLLCELHRYRRPTPTLRKLALSGLAAAILGLLPYLLSYRVAGYSLSFLSPSIPAVDSWTLPLRLGWFLYRGAYLLGPLALLVCLLAWLRPGRRTASRGWDGGSRSRQEQRLILFSIGCCAANLILYFRFPLEVSYLLPAGFFFLLLAGATLFRDSPGWTAALFLAILSGDFVTPTFAQHNRPGYLTGAHLHLSLAPGGLLADIAARRRFLDCRTLHCWSAAAGVPEFGPDTGTVRGDPTPAPRP